MENPLITVVVPIYNIAAFLPQCLDSLLAQTYSNYEALLIDDGSTDSSGEICNSYAAGDPRFHVYHQPNCGLSATRNRGMALAQGKFLTFLDGDDTAAPDFLAKLSAAAESHGADLTCCNYTVTDEAGQPLRHPRGKDGTAANVAQARTVCDFDTLMADTCALQEYYPTHVNAALFRTDTLRQLSFEPQMRFYEDGLFLFHYFCRRPKVVLLPYAGYFYRLRRNSITRAVTPYAIDSRQCLLQLRAQQYRYFADGDTPVPQELIRLYALAAHSLAYAAAQKENAAQFSACRTLLQPHLRCLRPLQPQLPPALRFYLRLYRGAPRVYQLLCRWNEALKG